MPSKRHAQRPSKGQPSTRSRTRSSKAILYDPAQNTELLNQQLHALGLYAAHTIGDGNCLFRALSDQLYGTPNYHLKLRDEICDWIASRKDRYAPFVDDERGLDVHLRCMRTPGTYGGHLELSAFAHCKRRNVKVIQPGLVYIIEWNTGVDDDDGDAASSPNGDADERDRRRMRRTKEKGAKSTLVPEPEDEAQGTIYVAYHDWEHFSSVRNISGPHNGIPNVVETVQPADSPAAPHAPPSKHKAKQALKTPKRVTRAAAATAKAAAPAAAPAWAPSPADIPLPPSPEPRSRASSPATQLSTSSVATASTAPSSVQTPPSSSAGTGQRRVHLRVRPPSSREGRSPKRSFEESDPDSTVEQEGRKRQRHDSAGAPDAMDDIGALSDTSSLSSLSSSDMDGAVSEADSSPPPPTPPPAATKPLTRRQRKALGLPKPRSAPVGGTGTKIKIPGGRFRAANAGAPVDDTPKKASEWQSNGVGRLDVRGFRELRI